MGQAEVYARFEGRQFGGVLKVRDVGIVEGIRRSFANLASQGSRFSRCSMIAPRNDEMAITVATSEQA